MSKFIELKNTEIKHHAWHKTYPSHDDTTLQAIIVLHDNKEMQELLNNHGHGNKSNETFDSILSLSKKHAIQEESVDKVFKFLRNTDIYAQGFKPLHNDIKVMGTIGAFKNSFNINFITKEMYGVNFTSYNGTISIPSILDGIIKGIIGFDNTPKFEMAQYYNGFGGSGIPSGYYPVSQPINGYYPINNQPISGFPTYNQPINGVPTSYSPPGKVTTITCPPVTCPPSNCDPTQPTYPTQPTQPIYPTQPTQPVIPPSQPVKPTLPPMSLSEIGTKAVYTPDKFADYYQFPKGYDGKGQTVALIEFGGGYDLDVLNSYFEGIGIAALGKDQIKSVEVLGGRNNYNGGQSDADGEVMSDIEVVHSLAPAAKILVFFAPNSGMNGYEVYKLAAARADIISTSWGSAESYESSMINNILAKASITGATIFAASGDNGAYDRTEELTVDFPASSPHAIAVGGTKLIVSSSGQVKKEISWGNEQTFIEAQSGHQSSISGSGGGFSQDFNIPQYQSSSTQKYDNFCKSTDFSIPQGYTAKLGVPDVSANADPYTGYATTISGKWTFIGGTSLSTPLWAALFARCNQKFGDNLAKHIHLHKELYELGKKGVSFTYITQGNNGYYEAKQGWDAVTGLGSPKGEQLCNELIAIANAAKTAKGESASSSTSTTTVGLDSGEEMKDSAGISGNGSDAKDEL